jgi:hypothetical protein
MSPGGAEEEEGDRGGWRALPESTRGREPRKLAPARPKPRQGGRNPLNLRFLGVIRD